MIAFQLQYNKCMSPAEQLPIRKSCCITKGNCNYHHHHHHHHYQFTKVFLAELLEQLYMLCIYHYLFVGQAMSHHQSDQIKGHKYFFSTMI